MFGRLVIKDRQGSTPRCSPQGFNLRPLGLRSITLRAGFRFIVARNEVEGVFAAVFLRITWVFLQI